MIEVLIDTRNGEVIVAKPAGSPWSRKERGQEEVPGEGFMFAVTKMDKAYIPEVAGIESAVDNRTDKLPAQSLPFAVYERPDDPDDVKMLQVSSIRVDIAKVVGDAVKPVAVTRPKIQAIIAPVK